MKDFQAELLCAIETAEKKHGVRQARLRQNIELYGAVAAVKDYMKRNRTSDGFDALCRLGQTQLSAEALVAKYHTLFTDEEVNFCFSLLCSVDYYKG